MHINKNTKCNTNLLNMLEVLWANYSIVPRYLCRLNKPLPPPLYYGNESLPVLTGSPKPNPPTLCKIQGKRPQQTPEPTRVDSNLQQY